MYAVLRPQDENSSRERAHTHAASHIISVNMAVVDQMPNGRICRMTTGSRSPRPVASRSLRRARRSASHAARHL
eukprot:3834574-Prymnesium_polylepis.1